MLDRRRGPRLEDHGAVSQGDLPRLERFVEGTPAPGPAGLKIQNGIVIGPPIGRPSNATDTRCTPPSRTGGRNSNRVLARRRFSWPISSLEGSSSSALRSRNSAYSPPVSRASRRRL